MNHEFWSRNSPRPQNPTLNSRYVTNLLTKQPLQQVYSKTDFTAPIKINQRAVNTLIRSNSVTNTINTSFNPQINPSHKQQKPNFSRMSKFGSSSLSKLPLLANDIEVYQKQRRGREVDIITQVPREYKDTIKVFPKIRFENYDKDFWRRKSFIEGLPDHAYNYYSERPNQNTQSSIFTQKV